MNLMQMIFKKIQSKARIKLAEFFEDVVRSRRFILQPVRSQMGIKLQENLPHSAFRLLINIGRSTFLHNMCCWIFFTSLNMFEQNYFCASKTSRGQILLCSSRTFSDIKYGTLSSEVLFEQEIDQTLFIMGFISLFCNLSMNRTQ